MKIKYEAIYMPYTENGDPSKGGFDTKEDAWAYIETQLCGDCKKYYKPLGSMCAAEWDVGKEELTNQGGR